MVGYPQPWRVDGQMGVGPCRAISAIWTIAKGKSETVRHQFVVYTGKLNDVAITDSWKEYTGQGSDSATWASPRRRAKRPPLSPANRPSQR